ncbi:SID1 transmembrane family member 1 [Holothuria leucospilota]|uniref:SID1 transmembrane family member 1 n=1 Tax=Holothuria leucospilota TaxID=206669 RepID=A0A9Q1BZL4_HOLLE|nr:SID1 transmembrane family member 1 [Holothuria leucospilota]
MEGKRGSYVLTQLTLTVWMLICLTFHQIVYTSCRTVPAEIGKKYQGISSKGSSTTYNYMYNGTMHPAVRISISSDATLQFPVSFVVLEQNSVLSWSIPYSIDSNITYSNVSHTLCPSQLREGAGFSIQVMTFSPTDVTYSVIAEYDTKYSLRTGQKLEGVAGPTQPLLLEYAFHDDIETVIITVTSNDTYCAYLSVQPSKCPVYDDFENLPFKGTFQTMTKQAAITVVKDDYPKGFYIIIVVHPNDDMCNSRFEPLRSSAGTFYDSMLDQRLKAVTVTVNKTSSKYLEPVLITIGIGVAFYIFIGIIVCSYWLKNWFSGRKNVDVDKEEEGRMLLDNPIQGNSTDNPRQTHSGSYGALDSQPSSLARDENKPKRVRLSSGVPSHSEIESDNCSVDTTDFDTLEDIELEERVYRSRVHLFLSDTTRQDDRVLEHKVRKYPWNLVTVAVFYALPVVQLVITYQIVVNLTGNQDTCYYNFLCTRPASVISAFNNVYSNIGYIMLGILFLLLVWRREIIYKSRIASGDDSTETTGIPKHYGLFYALAIALIVEGIMSACYHVCPNNTNFQFDTSFMYIIACLCMLKLYQQRHPDINPESYRSFFVFALVIFLGMLGVIFHNVYTYVIFFLIHVSICFFMSLHVYYKSTIRFDTGIFARVKLECHNMCAAKDFKPLYLGRFFMLLCGNVINWVLSLYGVITQPLDFASLLLAIFIINLLLYLSFYILMKLFHGERLTPLVLFFIFMTTLLWGSALYFFMQGVTAWQETPALSRTHNKPCIVLDFYDSHDIWHFLSAGGLFFSFLTILVLDDDLDGKSRDKIPVF